MKTTRITISGEPGDLLRNVTNAIGMFQSGHDEGYYIALYSGAAERTELMIKWDHDEGEHVPLEIKVEVDES